MASDRPELDDLLAHTRIHDWIAEQYSFALSEHDDQPTFVVPSLRESCVLPPDFEVPYITPSAKSPPHPQAQDCLDDDCYDAHEYLVQEMNSWRVPSVARDKPLPACPPCPPALRRGSSADDYESSSSSPSVSPVISRRRELPASPARKRPSLPLLQTSLSTPARSKPSYDEPDLDEDEHNMLTTSASYASLRTRASHLASSPSPTRTRHSRPPPQRLPSISSALNTPPLVPLLTPASMAYPYSPTTPTLGMHCRTPSTPHLATPPLTNSSSLSSTPSQIHLPSLCTQPSMPSLSSKPSVASLRHKPSYPELRTPVDEMPMPIARPRISASTRGTTNSSYRSTRQPAAEQSRWSLATSTDGVEVPPLPALPSSPRAPSTPGKSGKSFRTRLLSTISRLGKKPSVANLAAAERSTTDTSASFVPGHSRDPSSASSSVELGYLSDARDVDDPFARPPPLVSGDFADFLTRDSSCDSERLDTDASYITNSASYLSGTASYLTVGPVTPTTATSAMSEFGAIAHPSPADDATATARDNKKRNRLSWASARSARGGRRRLLVQGLPPAPDARIGELKPETLGPAEQAVHAWCEAFGEVRRVTRTPAGALALEWRGQGTAESVLAAHEHLRDGVQIPGAGTVSLALAECKRKLF